MHNAPDEYRDDVVKDHRAGRVAAPSPQPTVSNRDPTFLGDLDLEVVLARYIARVKRCSPVWVERHEHGGPVRPLPYLAGVEVSPRRRGSQRWVIGGEARLDDFTEWVP